MTSIGSFADGIPTTVTLYDLIPLIYKDHYLGNFANKAWYLDKLEHLMKADLLLAISECSRQEAIKWLGFPPERSINISAAADPRFCMRNIAGEAEKRLRQHYGLDHEFIMYGGGVEYRKNVENLISAYALLPQSVRRRHQLAVVCSVQPEERLRLSKRGRKAGLSTNELIFTGFVPEDHLVALYNICKAFIFPSLHEGFGLPALEAMSCGSAVIASNCSALPEVVGREDALFDPRSTKSIAERLHAVLTDEDYRKELIRHGLEQAKRFSWDQCGVRAISAFESLQSKVQQLPQRRTATIRWPKLAFISPLPPGRNGIAYHSAEFLPELARHYDIDVIVPQHLIETILPPENFTLHSAEWFETHADSYERVLYNFGNSEHHRYMFSLQAECPALSCFMTSFSATY